MSFYFVRCRHQRWSLTTGAIRVQRMNIKTTLRLSFVHQSRHLNCCHSRRPWQLICMQNCFSTLTIATHYPYVSHVTAHNVQHISRDPIFIANLSLLLLLYAAPRPNTETMAMHVVNAGNLHFTIYPIPTHITHIIRATNPIESSRAENREHSRAEYTLNRTRAESRIAHPIWVNILKHHPSWVEQLQVITHEGQQAHTSRTTHHTSRNTHMWTAWRSTPSSKLNRQLISFLPIYTPPIPHQLLHITYDNDQHAPQRDMHACVTTSDMKVLNTSTLVAPQTEAMNACTRYVWPCNLVTLCQLWCITDSCAQFAIGTSIHGTYAYCDDTVTQPWSPTPTFTSSHCTDTDIFVNSHPFSPLYWDVHSSCRHLCWLTYAHWPYFHANLVKTSVLRSQQGLRGCVMKSDISIIFPEFSSIFPVIFIISLPYYRIWYSTFCIWFRSGTETFAPHRQISIGI